MNTSGKLTVGLIYGGNNLEHEIYLMSSKELLSLFDHNKYEVVVLGLDKAGNWHYSPEKDYLNTPVGIDQVSLNLSKPVVYLASGGRIIDQTTQKCLAKIDLFFPSTMELLQGFLQSLDVPYVGCDIFATTITRDKDVTKRLLRDSGLPIVPFITLHANQSISFQEISQRFGVPLFVKPARLGSSIGVSKVFDEGAFTQALKEAFQYDRKVLVEQAIEGGEMECAVWGSEKPEVAQALCQLINIEDFFSYEVKYQNEFKTLEIPAKIDGELARKLRTMAASAFCVLECEGMARVDFLVSRNGDIFINEINTSPGLDQTYVYARLWKASGMPYHEMLDRLIQLALERHHQTHTLKTSLKDI